MTTAAARQTLAAELTRYLLAAPYRTLAVVDEAGLEVDDLAGDARQILAGALAWRDVLPRIRSAPSDHREGINLATRRRYFLVRAVCEALALGGYLRTFKTPQARWDQARVIHAVADGVRDRPFDRDTLAEICQTLKDLARERTQHAK